MKRSRLVLVVILMAVAVLFVSLWVGEGPLWRLVTWKRVYVETEICYPLDAITDIQAAEERPFFEPCNHFKLRGWVICKRFGDPSNVDDWWNRTLYYENGFKCSEEWEGEEWRETP